MVSISLHLLILQLSLRSAFLLIYHLIGELIPLTILFLYQYRSNILWLKNKMQLSVCKAANPDNEYNCGGKAISNCEGDYGEDDDDEQDSYYQEVDVANGNNPYYCGGAANKAPKQALPTSEEESTAEYRMSNSRNAKTDARKTSHKQ